MDDALLEHKPATPSSAQIVKWIWFGVGIGLAGVLFFGIICGPIAIYFGVRVWKAAAARGERGKKTVAAFVIGLGVFDVLFFIILAVGVIRVIGASG